MARTPRLDIGENYYHIINRANARLQIFNSKEDYDKQGQVRFNSQINRVRYGLTLKHVA